MSYLDHVEASMGYVLQPQMIQKGGFVPLYGRRTFISRPVSDATEIYDTDEEGDVDEMEQSPISLRSFGKDSAGTASTHEEIFTPEPFTAGLGGFDFHIDHEPSTQAYKEPFVRSWSPDQVAEWMADSGVDVTTIEKFLSHDITGNLLLELKSQDLRELNIGSYAKQQQVLNSIEQLKNETNVRASLSNYTTFRDEIPITLQRPVLPEEAHVALPQLRRGRSSPSDFPSDEVLPGEAVSIVAIEQLLPPMHKCAKGERCPKWQKQQRKIERLQREFAQEQSRPQQKSTAESLDESLYYTTTLPESPPLASPLGSSIAMGPVGGPLQITSERLQQIGPEDPQESVKQFLAFQMIAAQPPSPRSRHLALPKLTIPVVQENEDNASLSPISAMSHSNSVQQELKAQLRKDPFHYGGVASPVDMQHVVVPYSIPDKPSGIIQPEPVHRGISRSVPPQMQSNVPITTSINVADPVARCTSTQPATVQSAVRRPSFVPAFNSVREVVPNTDNLGAASYCGWMQKRKTTKFMRQEWQDGYFTLEGSYLIMHEDATPQARQLEAINVEQYSVNACSTAPPTKASSGFRKSILPGSKGPAGPEQMFAFSLVMDADWARKSSDKAKQSHHFVVGSTKERVEWMRQLMLAKALKKNDPYHRF